MSILISDAIDDTYAVIEELEQPRSLHIAMSEIIQSCPLLSHLPVLSFLELFQIVLIRPQFWCSYPLQTI